jgi:hypothetical protein
VSGRRHRSFATQAEAQAFIEGIELVNDSAIDNIHARAIGSGFVVSWTDEDAEGDDEQEDVR